MAGLHLVLLVAALVLFVIAASGFVPEPPRTRLIAAGLACWVASTLW